MSTPDSSLSPQERAAFADLEAAARAADPHLAARLSPGSRSVHARALPPRLVSYAKGRWQIALRHARWGAPLLMVGVVLMVVGLWSNLAVSVLGAGAAAVALRLLVHAIHETVVARRSSTPRRPGNAE